MVDQQHSALDPAYRSREPHRVAAQRIGRRAHTRSPLGMRHHRFDVQTVRQAEGGVAGQYREQPRGVDSGVQFAGIRSDRALLAPRSPNVVAGEPRLVEAATGGVPKRATICDASRAGVCAPRTVLGGRVACAALEHSPCGCSRVHVLIRAAIEPCIPRHARKSEHSGLTYPSPVSPVSYRSCNRPWPGGVVPPRGPTPSSFKELSRLRHGYRDTKR